ncbi:hypothetical protein EV646_12413 [Kribbella antiqua]|uniref:Uncharacterized protein n=1 Tax=Kribbella antiqua TaxID=2512217 RepID=A0A4R2I4C2_9ACTN|nr:hypothetical protein EV646_12413 [Kribbella antiqua]
MRSRSGPGEELAVLPAVDAAKVEQNFDEPIVKEAHPISLCQQALFADGLWECLQAALMTPPR